MPRHFAHAFRFLALGLLLLLAAPQPGYAQTGVVKPTEQALKEADLLKALKSGDTINGRVSIPDQRSANLMQPEGQAWRVFKTETLPKVGAIAILGMLVALCAFYAYRGKIRVDAGLSGRKIERFNGFERFTHWLTASSFIVLAITGLNVTFGKSLLLPLLGPDGFTGFSIFAKLIHNYIGFAFMAGVVLTFLIWVKDNFPSSVDAQWLAQGGGLFSKGKHPPAKRFNAGQKGIFWSVVVGGALLSISGLHLLFPGQVGGGVIELQTQSMLHGVAAMVLVAIIMAHVYIGSVGMEGAFDAMKEGQVDLNWAKEHHSIWVAETLAGKGDGKAVPPGAAPAE